LHKNAPLMDFDDNRIEPCYLVNDIDVDIDSLLHFDKHADCIVTEAYSLIGSACFQVRYCFSKLFIVAGIFLCSANPFWPGHLLVIPIFRNCTTKWLINWLIDLRPCQHDNGYMDGRSQIKVHTDERTQVHSAQSSLAVTHSSTNRTRRYLTSVTESPSKHWLPPRTDRLATILISLYSSVVSSVTRWLPLRTFARQSFARHGKDVCPSRLPSKLFTRVVENNIEYRIFSLFFTYASYVWLATWLIRNLQP